MPSSRGQQVDHALDQVHRLGDPERAGVGDTARRLVGVHAGDLAVRGPQVVGAGEDVEEPGRELGRLGRAVERAVVGQHLGPQAEDPAVPGRGDLAVHVVVAGERGGHQVLRPVLHPLDRLAGDDRADDRAARSPGRSATLLPNPPPMSGEMIRILCSGRPVTSAYSVRCACGAWRGGPDGELAADLVHVGHRAAGLQRGRVDARVEHVLGDHDVGGGEHRVGRRLVPGRPVEDVVVRPGRRCRRGSPGRRVEGAASASTTGGSGSYSTSISSSASRAAYRSSATTNATSWPWNRTLSVASTACTSRDSVGIQARLRVVQRLAGDDGLDLGVGLGRGGVDGEDPGVRQRAAQDRAVQHARAAAMSSTNVPWPRMNRASSLRRIGP